MKFKRITIHNDPLEPAFTSGPKKNLPLTDAAERAIRNATQAAVDRAETGLLSPVYLLWAILSWKGPGHLGLSVLESCGVDTSPLEQTSMSLIHVQSGQCVGGGLDLAQFGRMIERAG